MAKKYLLHRLTEEDTQYISEDTYTSRSDINQGNCYILVNKNNGKIYTEDGHLLIYKASGIHGDISDEKRRFLEAIEACAYFRGYANLHNIKFKTSKIAELLFELEDHEIEVPNNCDTSKIVYTENALQNREVSNYIEQASEGYLLLNELQRNLPTLALFVNEAVPEHLQYRPQEDENEIDEEEEEEYFPF